MVDGDVGAHERRLAKVVANPALRPNTRREHWFNVGTDWWVWMDPSGKNRMSHMRQL